MDFSLILHRQGPLSLDPASMATVIWVAARITLEMIALRGLEPLDCLHATLGGYPEWDPVDRIAWLYFYRDDERQWIFYTDARTFKERYTLVKDRGLRGFASWVLGTEDNGIWDLLPRHK